MAFRPSLFVKGGPLAGRHLDVDSQLVLGREKADLTIEDPQISRRHAVIRVVDDGLEIEDLGSLNGTCVNGNRIEAVTRLRPGDLIEVGGTSLEVRSQPVQRKPAERAARQSISPAKTEEPGRSGDDELRLVTALFADVVGSTGLGERLAPDEVKALIGECVTRMARAVEQYGGIVQAYMGDGIAGFFGVPLAHEDDPERAARAALRILQVVGEYARDIEAAWEIHDFNVRVGINTGQTAVGLVGGADPQSVTVGDTTNVAARLQSAAKPGTIAVGDPTAAQLTEEFILESLGDLQVKGRARPVKAWELVRRQASTRAPVRTPLFGRDAEVARLQALLDDLHAGRGQILSLVGDTGIGKTRLLGELRALAADRVTWLEGNCVSYGGELLLGPFVEMLRSWLGVEEGEAEITVRTKVRAKLGALLGARLDDVFPYLGQLLSVRLEPELQEQLRLLQPEALAEGIRAAYVAWVEALTASGPVVVAVEDAHWADPPTRELAEALLELTERAPLLLSTTLRADTASEGWRFRTRVLTERAHRAIELPVTPLSEAAAGELLDLLVPGGLDEVAKRGIVLRAEGNPLYLEELLRALVEGGGLERRQRTWALTAASGSLLPPALESLLVARIDRLAERARRLAQIAAVVGRTFPVRVLERVAESEDFDSNLAVLLRAEIVRELRRYPELELTFKHGLLQEAALSSLTPSRRRELYGRVAAAFEALFAPSLDDHLERLAFYYARSHDMAKALHYLERAGARAAALDSGTQAIDLWKRAEKAASTLSDPVAERRISARLEELGGRSRSKAG